MDDQLCMQHVFYPLKLKMSVMINVIIIIISSFKKKHH